MSKDTGNQVIYNDLQVGVCELINWIRNLTQYP
jgi:hypothetical protein